MKNAQSTQPSFDIEAIVNNAKANTSLMAAAMSHLADRLHSKLEIMLGQETLPDSISLKVDAEDKALFEAALAEGDSEHTFMMMANTVLMADKKAYFEYDAVESLFSTLRA